MKKVWLMTLCLAACGDKSTQQVDQATVLAQVGDVSVTSDVLAVAMKSRGLQSDNEAQKQQLFDELLSEAAMANQAVKKQLPMSQEQMALLHYQQIKYQAQNALAAYLAEHPVTDADIEAEYQQVIQANKNLQFHVQHLLFRDEVNAVQQLDAIQSGQVTFDQAMADYLSSRPQMRNVGDIGWVHLQQVPESFRSPLENMAVGAVYSAVINSEFGAHVLFLKDKKKATPPSLDVAKAGIKKSLEQRLANKFKQLAAAKAKVQLLQMP